MANVTVTATLPSVTVDSTTNTVNVATTTSNIIVSEVAAVSNSVIRQAITVSNVSGFGNVSFDSTSTSNGVIQYEGVSTADIRGQVSASNVSGYGGITYTEANGVIQHVGVSNTQIKDTAFNNIRMMEFDDQFTLGRPATGGWINYDQANGILQYRPLHYQAEQFVNGSYGNLNNEIGLNVTFLGNNFDTNFASKTTDNLTEGNTNQYFSTDLANSAIDNYTGSFANATINTTANITTTANIAGGNVIATNLIGTLVGDTTGTHVGTTTGNVLYTGNSNVLLNATNGDLTGRNVHATSIFADDGLNKGVQTQQISSGQLGFFPPLIGSDNSPNIGLYLVGLNSSTQKEPVTLHGNVMRIGTSLNANIVVSEDANTISLKGDSGISLTTSTGGNIDLNGGTNGVINVAKPLHLNNLVPRSDGNIEVEGNLNVQGNLNYVNVEDLFVNDERIVLNYGNASSRDAFIIVDRSGDSRDNVAIKWNNTSNVWQVSNDGTTFVNIPVSTSDLAEGSNLYFTNARANTVIGTNTTDNLSEGATNQYFTTARANSAIDARVTSTTANVNSVNGATGTVVLDTDNIAEGSANLYFTTDRANTSIGAYTGDMASVDDITANTLTTSNAILSQSTMFVQQQSNTSTGGIRAFEGGSTITNFNTNQPALNVENGLITIQASDETSNVFSVPRYAMGKLPDVATLTQDSSDDYGVLGATFDTPTAAMPGGVEAPTGAIVSTVNKRRAYAIPNFGLSYAAEGATSHSTGLIQFGVDNSNTIITASTSFGDVSGQPGFFTAPVANGTITFRTVQTDLLANMAVIAPYNEAVNLANSTVAYMDHKFNIGREDDNTSYNFPKIKGSKKDLLRLADDQGTLEFADQFSGQVSAQGNALGPLVFDMEDGDIFTLTTAGDLTSITVNNKQAGTRLTIIITQGTTTGALTGSADFLWAGGLKTLSTTTGDIDVIEAVYDGSKFYAQLTKGYVA